MIQIELTKTEGNEFVSLILELIDRSLKDGDVRLEQIRDARGKDGDVLRAEQLTESLKTGTLHKYVKILLEGIRNAAW